MENNVTDRKVFDRYLTDAEVRQLFSTLDKAAGHLASRDKFWIKLLLATGIRVGSLAQLTVDDAQRAIRDNRLHIRDEIAKGGKGYEIHASTKAREALRDLIRIRKSMEPACDALVLARTGEAMSVRSFQARMRMWVKAAKLRDGSPHWLRHTLAKRLIARSEASDPLAIAQLALGHSRRHTTTVYTLPDREDMERAMEAASK